MDQAACRATVRRVTGLHTTERLTRSPFPRLKRRCGEEATSNRFPVGSELTTNHLQSNRLVLSEFKE